MTDSIINLPDLDKNAFEVIDLPTMKVVRRVKIYEGVVEATPSGLKTDFEVTTLSVSTTVLALPATPLLKRNSIIIYNLSTTEILYMGKSSVTADVVDGITSGWQIAPNSYFSTDITDAIILYGVFATGTHKVQVLELA
jgi:hypothetical protein